MLSLDDLGIVALFDEAHLSLEEIERHIQSIFSIITKLVEPVNWDLEVSHVMKTDEGKFV